MGAQLSEVLAGVADILQPSPVFHYKKPHLHARRLLMTVPEEKRNHVNWILMLAVVEHGEGNDEEARRLIDQALSLEPDNPLVLGVSTELSLQLREYQKAVELSKRGSSVAPNNADFLVLRGLALWLILVESENPDVTTEEMSSTVAGLRKVEELAHGFDDHSQSLQETAQLILSLLEKGREKAPRTVTFKNVGTVSLWKLAGDKHAGKFAHYKMCSLIALFFVPVILFCFTVIGPSYGLFSGIGMVAAVEAWILYMRRKVGVEAHRRFLRNNRKFSMFLLAAQIIPLLTIIPMLSQPSWATIIVVFALAVGQVVASGGMLRTLPSARF